MAVGFGLYQVWISVSADWDGGKKLAETERKIRDLKNKVRRDRHDKLLEEKIKRELEKDGALEEKHEIA